MDRTLDVRTPESIAFSYELAGVGSRLLAVMIDLAIQVTLMFVVVWGFAFAFGSHPPKIHHVSIFDKLAVNIAIGTIVFVIFTIFFGYFIVLEAVWNGQTPGKKALGIRVVRDGGYPIDFTASLVRNLIRVGEMALGFYAISGISALVSQENKRIGDFAAGTIVIRESRMVEPELAAGEAAEPVYAATAYATGEERALVKRFLERRDDLEPEHRAELAARLASRLRSRLPAEMQRLDDEALLERL
jgi:uncharacterized RDD family membrane protein YckC